MIQNNTNESICRACGGACCKSYPGTAWPEQFGPDILSGLRKALASGEWEIDWWEGVLDGIDSPNFIRPAVKIDDRNTEAKLRRGLRRGECVFLSDEGCKLSWEERPSMCKALVPNASMVCDDVGEYTKEAGARAWIPFQDLIEEAASLI